MRTDENISDEIRKQLKEIILYLKLARSTDYIIYHALLRGDILKEIALDPLEKITSWSQKDEKKVRRLREKLAEETQGKTLTERSEKLHKILKIGNGIGILFKNDNKTGNK